MYNIALSDFSFHSDDREPFKKIIATQRSNPNLFHRLEIRNPALRSFPWRPFVAHSYYRDRVSTPLFHQSIAPFCAGNLAAWFGKIRPPLLSVPSLHATAALENYLSKTRSQRRVLNNYHHLFYRSWAMVSVLCWWWVNE